MPGSLRPGSVSARRLFASNDEAAWTSALERYEDAVRAVGVSRKKEKELLEWNRFVCKELAQVAVESGSLTKKQLVDVVNWKLTRGKFRPLMGQVMSNSDRAIEEATSKGFSLLGNKASGIKGPLAAIAELRGVGPATASAVLAPVAPDRFPFMSDEALEGCGLDRTYTIQAYEAFSRLLQHKAKELGGAWRAEDVGKALWSSAMADVYSLCERKGGAKTCEAQQPKAATPASQGSIKKSGRARTREPENSGEVSGVKRKRENK